MRNPVLIIVAGVAGAAAGIIAPRLLGPSEAARPATAPIAAPAPAATDPRVASIERQLRSVEQQLQAQQLRTQAQEVQPPAPRSEDLPELRAERERQAEVAHEAILARHRLESRDPRWASEREQTLSDQLAQAAGKTDMTVLAIDCRTQSCVARLQWPDRDAARAHLVALLDETAVVGCARRVQFPSSGAVPYQAEMYLECPHAP